MTTLIRKPAPSASAGVLRGEVLPLQGEVTELLCPYCRGSGTYIGGDEVQECFCQREAAEDRVDAQVTGNA